MMRTSPNTSAIVSLDGEFANRFYYWHGASGKRYIHSVYEPALCPALPGAVFIQVRRKGEQRIALRAGRFLPLWDANVVAINDHRHFDEVDEIHVHLLAKSDRNADEILADIQAAGNLPSAETPAEIASLTNITDRTGDKTKLAEDKWSDVDPNNDDRHKDGDANPYGFCDSQAAFFDVMQESTATG